MIKEVTKVWGAEVWINNDEHYCMKELHLARNAKCSYHYHKIKKETFYILAGEVELIHHGEARILLPGEYITIQPHENHSFRGITDSIILECSSQHFDDDSYRLDESKRIA